jgi:hypothetical protein
VFFSISLWCAHVTVTPEDSRMVVLRRGIWNGLKGDTPIGGQTPPISGVGDRLLWKNAQKNEKKNKTSERINRIIPHRIPCATDEVCCPWRVLSRVMSRHQT